MKKILFPLFLLTSLFLCGKAHANIVFPAISHQFMISTVVQSYHSVLMAIMILLVETYFIQELFSCKFIAGFALSFLINLASSLAGIFLLALPFAGANVLAYGNMRMGTYLGLVPGYIFTVMIEILLLFIIAKAIKQKIKGRELVKTAVIMNFFSYVIIVAGIAIADYLTKGEIFKTY